MKAKLQEPEYKAKHDRTIKNALIALNRPEVKAYATLTRTVGGGYARRDQRRFSWCPEEYLNQYRNLMNKYIKDDVLGACRRPTAAEARTKIEKGFGGPLRPLVMTNDDVARSQCRVDGKPVHLGPSELTIMLLLIGANPDRYVSSEEIIQAVYPNPNTQAEDADGVIKAQIFYLRRKGICIVNRYGKGYRIAPQVRGKAAQ